MGITGVGPDHIEDLKEKNKTPIGLQLVPINKVGKYCDSEEGNITLLIEYNNGKTMEILDKGAEIAIATRNVWEARGKLAI